MTQTNRNCKMAESTITSKPLRDGKKWHCSVIYNGFEGPNSGRQGDHKLAWEFFTDLKDRLSKKGYDMVKDYSSFLPGSNYFDNLSEMITDSEMIILLLTPKFLMDGWNGYSQQTARKELLDRKELYSRFIPIAINLAKDNIPKNELFSVSTIIYTGYYDKKADDGIWERIEMLMEATEVQRGRIPEYRTPTAPQMEDDDLQNDGKKATESSELELDVCRSGDATLHVEEDKHHTKEECVNNSNRNITSSDQPTGLTNMPPSNAANGDDIHSPMSNALRSLHLSDSNTDMPLQTDHERSDQREEDGASGVSNPEGNGTKPSEGSKKKSLFQKLDYFF